MRLLHLTALAGVLWALATGCSAADKKGNGGTDSDTDADTDTDTDTDADTDSDSDSDTDTDPLYNTIPETCDEAEDLTTSVGCSFYVVDMNNWDGVDQLPFAVAVGNPQEVEAEVLFEDLRGPGGTLRTVPGTEATIGPGELMMFHLTCVCDDYVCPEPSTHIEETGIGVRGAFRLDSSVPVLAYQWNPYGTEDSDTTDASLLIPETSLAGEYVCAVWNDGTQTQNRAEIVIVATEDATTVTFTPTVDTMAGPSVSAVAAGTESSPYSLNAYDVLQIAAAVDDEDLTGTVVAADKTIAVFGGHSCANVPDPEFGTCDHVEEQLLPLVAWGSETVLARYAERGELTPDQDIPVWRIVAGADAMTVTFDPPVETVGDTHSFALAGEVLEFESPCDHYASAELDDPPNPDEPEAPFLAYQMLIGWQYATQHIPPDEEKEALGDPSMLLSAPAGQYLDQYVFVTDDEFNFDYDHIIVVRGAGVTVNVDCLGELDDGAFAQVGASDWEVGRFYLDSPEGIDGCEDGPHTLVASDDVGLSVIGMEQTNSYAYLGGVGVREINPVIE